MERRKNTSEPRQNPEERRTGKLSRRGIKFPKYPDRRIYKLDRRGETFNQRKRKRRKSD